MPPPAALACYGFIWRSLVARSQQRDIWRMTDKGTEQDDTSGTDRLAEHVERYHQLARRTQNPMYAWLALQTLLEAGVDSSGEWPIQQQMPMPGWIAAYMLSAVQCLTALSAGIDFRKPVPELDAEAIALISSMEPEEYLKTEKFRQQTEGAHISLPKALELVPAALGLTRDGWNAFSSFEATTQKMHDANAYKAMKAAGVPAKVALHAIASEVGVKDPSHMHARLREGKSLVERDDEGKPGG